MRVGEQPAIPDYGGACLTGVVPALLEPGDEAPGWMPPLARHANQVVLLALDGLGWEQLQTHRHLAPTIAGLAGAPISSVVPSTTATALTSISTGLTPGEHGIVGYRLAVGGEVLNVLRWTTPSGDRRKDLDPRQFQPNPAFLGHQPPVVTRTEFAKSGFTEAHLSPVRFRGYRMASSLVVEVKRLLTAAEPFVYAYYDGIDKIAHEYGLDEHYRAELVAADRLVADLLEVLPPGAVLLVTADHGEVHVGNKLVHLDASLSPHVMSQSGEGRFRWLHARPGRSSLLYEAAVAHHEHQAWVRTIDQVVDEGWFGPKVGDDYRRRLGDVALIAKDEWSFVDEADQGPLKMIGRHGSVTAAEMLVPLVAGSR